jgi:hypothetical protein
MIEWLLRFFDHLLLLCKFVIIVLIIIIVSLNIVYHLLYVMHLKHDISISQPQYICLVHNIMLFFDTGRDRPL